MNVNLICPIIVLENELNPDIRKNDVKKFKLLVNSSTFAFIVVNSLHSSKTFKEEDVLVIESYGQYKKIILRSGE